METPSTTTNEFSEQTTTMLQAHHRHRHHQSHPSIPTENTSSEDYRTILNRVVEHLRSTIGTFLETANPPPPQPTHFKDVVNQVIAKQHPTAPPPLTHFCIYFLFTAVADASIRLNDAPLHTEHGWRRTVGVVKRLHATVNTLCHTCELCAPPFCAVCMALLEGLWMDEGAVEMAGDEGSRNGVMLGVLAKVCAELTAVYTSGAADFLGSRAKAQLGVLISVMEGWVYVPERFSEEGRKEVVVSEPAEKRAMDSLPAINRRVEQQPTPQPAIPVKPPTNRATNLPNQKPPPPPQIPKRPPPPPNVKAILPIIVTSLDHLTACIDTSTTSVVFDAVSCLADAVRGAVASINGADLSVQAHWDHAVWLAGMLAETAHDLGHWAVPLSRPLAETLFAVRRGVMFTDREMGCEGGARSAVVVSMLGRVGRGLYGLMDGREGFYGYMGREAEAEMVGMVEMLVALAVV